VAVFEGDVLVGPKLAPDQSVSLHSPDVRKAPRFVPDLNTLRFFLDATYFTRISEVYLDLNTMHKASAPPEGVNRVLMICKPSVGIRNPCHVYKPPFGLHEYDIRRAKPANEWSELG
jgi:hypothetical protein